ncbi:hypothetical protein NC653_000614 [Populus alba x Populus x berolinensis]|uniref:Beta-amyrin synthase n=1 Tax=Populus alba x Populus x berolinensis TaxID=444605 RepID=A0AAD6WGV9_9ROSI|nr:hypothetical protein NC653_000614 [Populus alba x Populus x berolinensis]
MFRHISKGSWTFSDKDHGWQVSDCTAECMKVRISCIQMVTFVYLKLINTRERKKQFQDMKFGNLRVLYEAMPLLKCRSCFI